MKNLLLTAVAGIALLFCAGASQAQAAGVYVGPGGVHIGGGGFRIDIGTPGYGYRPYYGPQYRPYSPYYRPYNPYYRPYNPYYRPYNPYHRYGR